MANPGRDRGRTGANLPDLAVRNDDRGVGHGLVGRSGDQSEGAYLVIGAEVLDEAGPMVSFRSFSRRAPSQTSRSSSSLGFSSRSASSSSRSSFTPPPRQTRNSPTSNDSAYERYVEALIKKYDSNEDGELDAKEQSQLSRKPPAEADTDGNGRLSVKEFVKWIQNR